MLFHEHSGEICKAPLAPLQHAISEQENEKDLFTCAAGTCGHHHGLRRLDLLHYPAEIFKGLQGPRN